jgi:hypothetical protein
MTSRSSSWSSATRCPAARSLAAALLCGALGAIAGLPAAGAGQAVPPCTPISVQPLLTAPAAGDISLRGATAACDTIEVEVAAHGVPGIFTVAFDLAYPTGTLRYEGYAQGTLLMRGPPRQSPLFLVREPSPGTLQVSMTRFFPDPPVAAPVEGGEGLIRLRFRRVAAGRADIDFIPGAGSAIAEKIVDGDGKAVAARFTPGHGATVIVP